jgi:hypothetical protein
MHSASSGKSTRLGHAGDILVEEVRVYLQVSDGSGWENAARGGTQTRSFWGNDTEDNYQYGNEEIRVAYRYGNEAVNRCDNSEFRLARNP